MFGGVGKSGSPISMCSTRRPCASRARARARTSKAVSVPRSVMRSARLPMEASVLECGPALCYPRNMDVALFVPCYVDQLYPRVGFAAAEVLERHGARVIFPADQTCCGQPMANSGCEDDARPLA